MFFNNNIARMVFLSLLSQAGFVHALPVEGDVNELAAVTDTAVQKTGALPPPPPGPYFSSAMPNETAVSKPIQMPASVPVSEQNDKSLETISKEPEPIQVQKIKQAQKSYDIESTNPLAEWPRSVESTGEPTVQWSPAPPAPPGPYGFVPNYTPRSAVNPAGRYGYGNPYYPASNAYGAPYGRPAPGLMYPQMNPGYANPGYSNPGYSNPGYSNPGYYGHPNQGAYNQRGFNRGGFDQRIKRNNLNQSDMNQGKPK